MLKNFPPIQLVQYKLKNFLTCFCFLYYPLNAAEKRRGKNMQHILTSYWRSSNSESVFFYGFYFYGFSTACGRECAA